MSLQILQNIWASIIKNNTFTKHLSYCNKEQSLYEKEYSSNERI